VRDVQPLLKHLHSKHHTGVLNDPFDYTLNDRCARSEIAAFLRHGFASRLQIRQVKCRQNRTVEMLRDVPIAVPSLLPMSRARRATFGFIRTLFRAFSPVANGTQSAMTSLDGIVTT